MARRVIIVAILLLLGYVASYGQSKSRIDSVVFSPLVPTCYDTAVTATVYKWLWSKTLSFDSMTVDVGVGTIDIKAYWFKPNIVAIGGANRQRVANIGQLAEGTYTVTTRLYQNSASGTKLEDTEIQTLIVDPCCGSNADFSASNTTICKGDNVTFTNASSNSIGYEWYVDGTQFSTATNSNYTFNTAGSYDVTLRALDTTCYDSMTQTISVYAEPVATGFTYASSNLNWTFTDTNSVNELSTSWWSFGDGNTDSGTTVSHTYATTGSYTVCLTVSNLCGLDTICENIVVDCPLPVANYGTTVTGLKVNFHDSTVATSAINYFWTFGDGGFSSIQNPTYTYSNGGTYDACLHVTTECGSDTLCQEMVVSDPGSGIATVNAGALDIHPNPMTSVLHIAWEGMDASIELQDMLGRRVRGNWARTSKGYTMHRGALVAGLYFITLRSDRKVYRSKLIIE